MTFLRNRWYAAAWSSEVGAKPLGRKILGESITFFRTESGKPVALASRCPHRFAPLYFGDVIGENIKCKYHGLQFGPNGACAANPDGSSPPPIGVKSYTIAEKDAMLWIWMGDKEPQGEAPDTLHFEPHLGAAVRGLLQIDGHYQLVVDNLLDSAHATHLHSAFETEGHKKAPRGEVRQEGDTIYQSIRVPDTPLIPAFRPVYHVEGNVDMALDFKWEAPSSITIGAWVVKTGGVLTDGFNQIAIHLITPETENSCHYFWCTGRNAALDDHEYSAKLGQIFQNIFITEDKWMIEGQQEMMDGDEFWSLQPAMLPQDKATALCRRHNDKLISEQRKAEQSA